MIYPSARKTKQLFLTNYIVCINNDFIHFFDYNVIKH